MTDLVLYRNGVEVARYPADSDWQQPDLPSANLEVGIGTPSPDGDWVFETEVTSPLALFEHADLPPGHYYMVGGDPNCAMRLFANGAVGWRWAPKEGE